MGGASKNLDVARETCILYLTVWKFGLETDSILTGRYVWKSQLDGTGPVGCGNKITTLPTALNALRIDPTLGLCWWAPATERAKGFACVRCR